MDYNNIMNAKSDVESVETAVTVLEQLSEKIENNNNLEDLLDLSEKFLEKLSLVTDIIKKANIRLSILQKSSDRKINLNNDRPVLENFIIQDFK